MKLRLTFNFAVAGTNIDSSRVSKHNEGLERPRGIKVKEKMYEDQQGMLVAWKKAKKQRRKDDR